MNLDLSAPALRREEEMMKFFRANAVQHPGIGYVRLVLPFKAFEEYTGVNVAEHPLFFRPEIFSGGSDFNICGGIKFFTLDGFCKAVTALATLNIIERSSIHGQNQPA